MEQVDEPQLGGAVMNGCQSWKTPGEDTPALNAEN
jgi:hypothetical protein